MNAKKVKYKNGFTLVETLMVAVIIAAIVALLMPIFSSQSEQTKISKTKANLSNVRMAIDLYYQNERVWPNDALSDLYDGTSPSTSTYIATMPEDGIMENNTVTISPDYVSGGWYWDNINHEVYINLSGTDANGDQYAEY